MSPEPPTYPDSDHSDLKNTDQQTPQDRELIDQLAAISRERTPSAVQHVLLRAFETLAPQKALLTSGLGMEGCALIDIAAPLDLPLRVVFLDTAFHFKETLELLDRLIERYPRLEFETVHPAHSAAEQAECEGDELWLRLPDRCCALRKIEPLAKHLSAADLWISAIGRSQSETRADIPTLAASSRFALPKLSPLVHWRRSDVWSYVQEKAVPFNPLHLRGYPSISCQHCTLPVPDLSPDQYSRAGRWSPSSKTECGLHETARSSPGTSPRTSPLPILASR